MTGLQNEEQILRTVWSLDTEIGNFLEANPHKEKNTSFFYMAAILVAVEETSD